MEKHFWNYGEKSRVARAARMTPQHLNDILTGARSCGRKRARRLETATLVELGEERCVPAAAWVGFQEHPALAKGQERKELA